MTQTPETEAMQKTIDDLHFSLRMIKRERDELKLAYAPPTDHNQALRDALAAMRRIYRLSNGVEDLKAIDTVRTFLDMQEPASEPAPASAPSCCGELQAEIDRQRKINTQVLEEYEVMRQCWERARCGEFKEALENFVGCFETFKGSLGKSLQGWDYPRLHRAREKALALLETKGAYDATPVQEIADDHS